MDYPKDRKEFYELIERKRKEVSLLNIPDEEKNRLYKLIDETVQTDEELQTNYVAIKESFNLLGISLGKIYRGLKEVRDSMKMLKEKLPVLEKIVLHLRISKAGRKQNPLNN